MHKYLLLNTTEIFFVRYQPPTPLNATIDGDVYNPLSTGNYK